MVKYNRKTLASIDPKCYVCGGRCWHGKDQARTQADAQKMFGTKPNHCVNGENGTVYCPAALGLLGN